VLGGVVALALVATACGTDDDASPGDTATPPVTDPAGTDPAGTDPAGTDPAGTGSITLYSGRGEDLVGPIIERFTEVTGIDVQVRYGDSAEMLLLIQEEGANSPADVYYAQGAGFLGTLSAEGGLLRLPDDILEQVAAGLRSPADDWVGITGRARTVVYNTDALTEDELPDSLVDFADPAWKGRIGWVPTNASFQDHVTALRFILGDDATRAWLQGIVANEPLAYEKNGALVEAVAAGEVDVGFVNHYYLYQFLAEDPSFAAANKFFPDADVGALVNIAGAGIVATSDQPDAAAELIRFLLSDEAQRYFAETNYELPVTAGVDPAEGLPRVDSLRLPEFDLNLLTDLEGTVDMLIEVGAL
jgi:iron(III) transport system substrate-binding protein